MINILHSLGYVLATGILIDSILTILYRIPMSERKLTLMVVFYAAAVFLITL